MRARMLMMRSPCTAQFATFIVLFTQVTAWSVMPAIWSACSVPLSHVDGTTTAHCSGRRRFSLFPVASASQRRTSGASPFSKCPPHCCCCCSFRLGRCVAFCLLLAPLSCNQHSNGRTRVSICTIGSSDRALRRGNREEAPNDIQTEWREEEREEYKLCIAAYEGNRAIVQAVLSIYGEQMEQSPAGESECHEQHDITGIDGRGCEARHIAGTQNCFPNTVIAVSELCRGTRTGSGFEG